MLNGWSCQGCGVFCEHETIAFYRHDAKVLSQGLGYHEPHRVWLVCGNCGLLTPAPSSIALNYGSKYGHRGSRGRRRDLALLKHVREAAQFIATYTIGTFEAQTPSLVVQKIRSEKHG